jgi:hypothetical protein
MAKLSRRTLIAGAAAAPLAGTAGAPAPAPADPVVPLARVWIVERETADALLSRWGRLEDALPVSPTLSLTQALRSGLPEAREMRAIDRRVRLLLRKLARDAEHIVPMQAVTAEGGLAKIEMALKILEPVDVEEFSWALVQAGVEDLRRLI